MARRSGVLRGLVALPPPPHRHALPPQTPARKFFFGQIDSRCQINGLHVCFEFLKSGVNKHFSGAPTWQLHS
jgi:hypothetical protein